MAIKKELVDELLKDADPKKVFGSEGLLDEIKKALAERMLNAELDEHLAAESAAADSASRRAGKPMFLEDLKYPQSVGTPRDCENGLVAQAGFGLEE